MSQQSEKDSNEEPTYWATNVHLRGVTRSDLQRALKRSGYRSASAFFSDKAVELVNTDPRKAAIGCLRRAAHYLENEMI